MKKLSAVLATLLFVSTSWCSAEIKTFTASEQTSVRDNESVEQAKERAFKYAVRTVSVSAGVYVESYTKVQKAQVLEDTITVISSNVIKVNSVEYLPILYSNNGEREVNVNIVATVDTDEINRMSEKFQQYEFELNRAKEKLLALENKVGQSSSVVLNDPMPNIIISHNDLWGEVDMVGVLKSYVVSNRMLNIYKEPYESSPIVGNANANGKMYVIATELHTYPQKGKTKVVREPFEEFKWISGTYSEINAGKILPSPGEYIYILYYKGEGVYVALYRDNIIFVPQVGIKNPPGGYKEELENGYWAVYEGASKPSAEEWLCVRKSNGVEGWIPFKGKKDWQTDKIGRVFHYPGF